MTAGSKRRVLVPLYFWLGGLAGGLLLVGGFARWSEVSLPGVPDPFAPAFRLAFPFVCVAAGLLVLDLSRPRRFLNVLRTFKWYSAVSLGAWGLPVFGAVSAVYFLAELPDGRWPHAQPAARAASDLARALVASRFGGPTLSLLAFFAGSFLAAYTGVLLSVSARPFWRASSLLGGLHLAAGAASALGLLLAWAAWAAGADGSATGPAWRAADAAPLASALAGVLFLQGGLWLVWSRRAARGAERLGGDPKALARPPARGPARAGAWGGTWAPLALLLGIALAGAEGDPAARVAWGVAGALALLGGLPLRAAIFWAEKE